MLVHPPFGRSRANESCKGRVFINVAPFIVIPTSQQWLQPGRYFPHDFLSLEGFYVHVLWVAFTWPMGCTVVPAGTGQQRLPFEAGNRKAKLDFVF